MENNLKLHDLLEFRKEKKKQIKEEKKDCVNAEN